MDCGFRNKSRISVFSAKLAYSITCHHVYHYRYGVDAPVGGFWHITLAFDLCGSFGEGLPEHLLGLLESLKDILQEPPRTRIFVTGGPLVETETKIFLRSRYYPSVRRHPT